MKSSRVWLAFWAVLACTRPAGAPADQARGETAAATGAPRDSTWVEVRGPTLVAFWPANAAAAIDSGGDAATALDDFGYHLESADSGLRALGVRVVSLEGRTFHLVTGGRVTSYTVPRDSVDLGYYLVAPGRAPTVYYGVHTDADLLDIARQYLARSVRRP